MLLSPRICRLPRAVAVFALSMVALTTAPSVASADTYGVMDYACGGGGAGQTDERGILYVPCGGTIRVMSTTQYIQTINYATTDVAPSPDGQYLYVNPGYQIRRLVRGGDNVYRLDPNWKPAGFNFGATRVAEPKGRYLATDGFGNIYVSQGVWATDLTHPATIIKYRPDGSYVTNFGQEYEGTAAQASSWADGRFYNNSGIAVSRDGRRVYVTEVQNSRVQRFDWQNNGGYTFARKWGNTQQTDPNRQGLCGNGQFAAPYDIGVDAWGFVYVANTSCPQVQKFTADGQFITSNWIGVNANKDRIHGIAVDANGNVYAPERNKFLFRNTAVPGPWPAITEPVADNTAPTLTQVTLPAQTTTAAITVKIAATDNVKPTQVAFANEDGVWGAWKELTVNADGTLEATHTLTAGNTVKGVTTIVRDAAGNESNTLYRTTRVVAEGEGGGGGDPADATAPTLNGVTVPATSTKSEIAVQIDAADNVGVTGMRFADDNGVWQAWKPFAANTLFTLRAGDGPRGVFVQVRDGNGNESASVYRAVKVDSLGGGGGGNPGPGPNAAPVLQAATLPNPAATQVVNAQIQATDDRAVTGVRLANEDGNWQAWKPFAATVQHALSPGAGPKAVFVQVRDAAGVESNVVLQRTNCTPCTPPAGFHEANALRRVAYNGTKVYGTKRADRVYSTGRRDQTFYFGQRDSKRDHIDCGLGYDVITVRGRDRTINCERVIRRR